MTQVCFHCDSEIIDSQSITTSIDGELKPFCCIGCKSVTEHIINAGLKNYYDFRTDKASRVNAADNDINKTYTVYDDCSFLPVIATKLIDGNYHIVLTVENIHCAACAWLIEQSVIGEPGIIRVNVNTITQRADVTWDQNQIKLSEILSRLSNIGYPASPFKISDKEDNLKKNEKAYIRRIGVAGLFTMQVMMLAFAMYFGVFENMESHQVGYFKWLSLALSVPVVFYSALPFLFGAIKSLKSKALSMDVPVATAIYGAFGASAYQLIKNGINGEQGEVYFESISMFTFLLLIGKYLEFKAKSKAVLSNANLDKTLPLTVTKLNGDDVTQTVLLNEIKPLDRIRILPGEHIAVDARVINGSSSTNESILNGEFEPISKNVNDSVLAGSVNNDGILDVEVSAVGENTTLSKILDLKESFSAHKPKYTEYADRIAHWFVLSQLVLALITYIIWLFYSPTDALWVSLSVLVATCPCALSLATPTAYTCIMSTLNEKGVLIKSPESFDKINQIDHVVFDKTGTLTLGKFTLQETKFYSDAMDKSTVESLVYKLESYSEHPVAKAFDVNSLNLNSETMRSVSLSKVTVEVGNGIVADWEGKSVKIGSIKYLNDYQKEISINTHNVFLIVDDQLIVSYYVADQLREESKKVISNLKRRGINISLLTGDASNSGHNVASELEIDNVKTACSAKDKAEYVTQLQQQEKIVLAVGDGLNDTPIFSASDVSLAMSKGADITKHTADIINLKDDLTSVLTLFKAAKETRKTIKNNLIWSIIYNIVILPVAMLGYVAPYIAVIGMSASSILVVTNSLKLLKLR
jgi:Cu2+-exporting ATPase